MTQHTKGPWLDVWGELGGQDVVIRTDNGWKYAVSEDVELMKEAGTVATECGLTPRQLLDQRNELLEALKEARDTIFGVWEAEDFYTDMEQINKFDEVIKKAEASNV